MSLIQISERPIGTDGTNAAVRFNLGPEYLITISNPFSEKEEQELEWYFEEHLAFPFTNKIRAQNAAASITTYGELLFQQIFSHTHIYDEYRNLLVQSSLPSTQIEITGSPAFHSFHWEALKDPEILHPLLLQATVVRKNVTPQRLAVTVRSSQTINILVVTARPSARRDIGYRTASRPLVEALRQTTIPIQIEILHPGTYQALENHLRDVTAKYGEGYYHVIHFDVHGAVLTYEQLQQGQQANRILYNQRYAREDIQPYEGAKAFLSFESEQEDNRPDLVNAAELADLLINHQVPITILNACQSGKQIGARETSLGSRLVQAGVQLVLAMGYSITVSAAELLMRTLYQRLFAGDDLSIAIRHARTELYNHKERRAYFDQQIDLEDWLLPVVYQNQPVQIQPREFTPEERNAYNRRKLAEKQYAPPEPQYGFVGRDLDILQIEKRLLAKRNLLLIRGMGGAGKTTLLKHLRAWWHTTGFVQQTFYFGYDAQAYTLQQILTTIAQQLYGAKYYTDIQPYPLDEQQFMLAERLRAEPHLLILDNLESITGARLAIGHTLPTTEQEALRGFLADLAKGKTLVLLGSRGGEDWLAHGIFDDNRYDLPGLDPEAASMLANRILERNNAKQYRDDENLLKLIKLLDGFPLALEVVLANLKQQTPAEVLAALQAGDVKLDVEESKQQGKDIFEQKTESILRCIDYSHSNLSPDAQQLLLCLAPFTSVIWTDENILNNYINELKQQPALSALPFIRWSEVIREAQNWGLLSPDPNTPGFLRLQPTLTYFLRNRLHESGQTEMKQAIETAFREHYDGLGGMLNQLLESKKPQERQIGQLLTGLEYENLVAALNLALEVQDSISNIHNVLLEYFDTTQNQRRGLELYQSVLERFERYPSKKLARASSIQLVNLIGTIANWQLDLKQFSDAEASYKKLLSAVQQLVDIDGQDRNKITAGTYHNLGRVAQEQRQFAQAEQYYQQALQIFIEYNDRYEQASTCHQLGRVAQEQRQWPQAEQYYQQALQIKIEYNNRYSQASTYHQLGIVAQEQRQWPQAEQYYQQALQIKIEYNDRYSQASTYHQLGMVTQEEQQWPQAEQYYQQALQIFIEYNDRYEQASTYHQLGIVAQEQRQWPQAEQYYQQALQIKIEYNDRYSQASTYHQLGIVAQEQRQWPQAREFILKALKIFVEYQDNHSASIVLHSLARLWRASDDLNLLSAAASILETSHEEIESLLTAIIGG